MTTLTKKSENHFPRQCPIAHSKLIQEMTVVDLTKRLTDSDQNYHGSISSDESLILVRPLQSTSIEISSLDLTVGNRVFDSIKGEPREISNDGIVLAPGQAVVVYTAEQVGLPYNVFGLVAGKGTLIFLGVFTSPGKIDPGFHDRLRIGMFNASRSPIVLKPGMAICSCSFFQIESHLSTVKPHHLTEPAKPFRPSLMIRTRTFVVTNWRWILTTVIAIIAAVAAVIRAIK